MRGHLRNAGRDARFLDLIAVFALLLSAATAFGYWEAASDAPATTTTFIVPSQTTHW
jgi:hypothetical protein